MNSQFQDLVSTLSKGHSVLLTSLLCTENPTSWDDCKHIVVCPIPLLTLEMAINRVIVEKKKSGEIPSPEQIKTALEYAQTKRKHYLDNCVDSSKSITHEY